jgi:hypothetical protein
MTDSPVSYPDVPAVPDVPVVDHAFVDPTAVPTLSTKDRLKAIRVKSEVVDVSDDDVPLLLKVSGLDTVDAMSLSGGDDVDPEEAPNPLAVNPKMMRLMVTDPDTGEHIYADWTDDEINHQPMSVTNGLMLAANRVLGRTSAPGKDLPSTTGGGSSS